MGKYIKETSLALAMTMLDQVNYLRQHSQSMPKEYVRTLNLLHGNVQCFCTVLRCPHVYNDAACERHEPIIKELLKEWDNEETRVYPRPEEG